MASEGVKKIKCGYVKCKVRFEPTRPWHKFHDPKCRYLQWKVDHPHISSEDRKLIADKLGIKL